MFTCTLCRSACKNTKKSSIVRKHTNFFLEKNDLFVFYLYICTQKNAKAHKKAQIDKLIYKHFKN